ncbi:hypothetical protein EW146_g5144 [Bondarzewia mesenterica]|uniref:Cytochrome P450 n=1 Tax=Bondarzewia mesenterica TaxID=1095465 RepID=A0A4S4LUH6_9AGAM|nr:hypothetical protein EW146_g5144 [Bondarzewia mesenterica]
MLFLISLCALVLLAIHRCRRATRTIVSKVRGPPATTWYGPALDFMEKQVGEADFPWLEEYGSVVRLRVPLTLGFGDILLISDPKALRHMHQTAFKDFGANALRHAVMDLMTGPGIGTAQGLQHVRQQRVIQPGFAVADIKAQIPKFSNFAIKLVDKWSALIAADSGTSTIIDVTEWNIKFTLCCMGVAVLDYEFGALDGKDDPLMEAVETMGTMLKGGVISMSISKLVPPWVYQLVFDYSWSEKIRRMRYARELCTTFAERLVEEKTVALKEGRQRKDTMTFLFAANSTLAHTMHWLLYELARHPEYQRRLKDDVRGKQPQSTNLDSLPFLNAFVKEILRMHPVAFMVTQVPKVDTVLPLSQPITLTTGEVINQLPIPKGQNIMLKSIWGEDAHVFNPDRWLREDMQAKSSGFGMYSSLGTFLGGPKGCIGWRMAVVVLQVYAFEVASKFKFSQTEDTKKVRRHTSVFMLPKIDGKLERGICLPLVVELDDD